MTCAALRTRFSSSSCRRASSACCAWAAASDWAASSRQTRSSSRRMRTVSACSRSRRRVSLSCALSVSHCAAASASIARTSCSAVWHEQCRYDLRSPGALIGRWSRRIFACSRHARDGESDNGSPSSSESSARVREAALLEIQDAPPPPSESRTGVSGLVGIDSTAARTQPRASLRLRALRVVGYMGGNHRTGSWQCAGSTICRYSGINYL